MTRERTEIMTAMDARSPLRLAASHKNVPFVEVIAIPWLCEDYIKH